MAPLPQGLHSSQSCYTEKDLGVSSPLLQGLHKVVRIGRVFDLVKVLPSRLSVCGCPHYSARAPAELEGDNPFLSADILTIYLQDCINIFNRPGVAEPVL